MKKYDSYKDSGVEWIGEIPSHWVIKKVKYVILKNNGIQIGPFGSSLKSDFVKSFGYKIYGQENVIKSDFSLGYKYLDEDKFNELCKYEIFEKDIVITMMGTTGRCQVVPKLKERGLMDSHLIRIRVNEEIILSNYFATLVNDSYSILNNIKIESKGSIMEGLNSSIIKSIILPLPNLSEQIKIINYLNRKIAEIDQLIADKKRLLELYEEEKTAIINQAVTKGLNPDAPMKDSGIEWLGEIPAHWEVKKLKNVSKVQTGRTPKIQSSKFDFFENGNINWFTPADFDGNNQLLESKRRVHDEAVKQNEVELFPEYSIYLVSIGATIGKVSFYPGSASANQQINVISFDLNKCYPLWGFYFLVGNKEMITIEADYTTLPILNQTKTKNLWICLPPKEEQQIIVQHIESECLRIDGKKETTQKLIDLLTEYRTALISEVVTGKIKVTG